MRGEKEKEKQREGGEKVRNINFSRKTFLLIFLI